LTATTPGERPPSGALAINLSGYSTSWSAVMVALPNGQR
jgi:hypothetical protein